jgi:hypothetical protein
LKKRELFVADKTLMGRLPRMLLATAVMAFALALLQNGLWAWFSASVFKQIVALAALVASGMIAYGAVASVAGAYDISQAKKLLRRKNVG